MNIAIVTDVLDHTCEFAGVLLQRCQECILELERVATFWLFSDCGKHFRASGFVEAICQAFCEKFPSASTMCSSVEKHGKGLVDGLLSTALRWLSKALLVPGTLITEETNRVDMIRKAAKKDNDTEPDGPRYDVVHFTPGAKPLQSISLLGDDMHNVKTY